MRPRLQHSKNALPSNPAPGALALASPATARLVHEHASPGIVPDRGPSPRAASPCPSTARSPAGRRALAAHLPTVVQDHNKTRATRAVSGDDAASSDLDHEVLPLWTAAMRNEPVHDANRARTLPATVTDEGWDKRVSFVGGVTMRLVDQATQRVARVLGFSPVYWNAILTQQPSSTFRSLSNRSLPFWVHCFRKWRAWRIQHRFCGVFLTGEQLQDALGFPPPSMLKIAALFDWKNASETFRGQRLKYGVQHGWSNARISILELLASGVFVSKSISAAHKLTFLLGFVDHDSTGFFDVQKFELLLLGLIRGLGAIYAIPASDVPSPSMVHRVAHELFQRIDDACATQRGHRAGSGHLRQGELTCWWSGRLLEDDPEFAPLQLTLMRFCSSRADNTAEEGCDELQQQFTLSYDTTCDEGADTEDVPAAMLLTRSQVLLAREVLEYTRSVDYEPELAKIFEIVAKSKVDDGKHIAVRFGQALRELNHHAWLHGGADLAHDMDEFLHQLCPQALPKHMRIYHEWLDKYDEFTANADTHTAAEDALSVFRQNDQKPIWPRREVREIELEFQRLDRFNCGYLSADDLVSGWGLECDAAEDAVRNYGGQRGAISLQGFLSMNCPDEYRLPQMSGDARNIFGELLLWQATEHRRQKEDTENFLSGKTLVKQSVAARPGGILPPTPQELIDAWTLIFDSLDHDRDGQVNITDLLDDGILSVETAHEVGHILDPDGATMFTLDTLLASMSKARGFRFAPEVPGSPE